MKDIKEYTRKELGEWFKKRKIKPFRAIQIFKWLYIHQANSFDEMTDISKDMRLMLKQNFFIPRLKLENLETSIDGTEKLLFKLRDNKYIESVIIPGKNRHTLCISSQVGCAQKCKFCLTAKTGLQRNLTCSEIISQISEARQIFIKKNKDKDKDKKKTISNIVFMGMGEPLANYANVIKSIAIITDGDYGMKISPRRVTVSTSGFVPQIKKLGVNTNVNLAISLNATEDKTRSMLMPINKKYPIKNLLQVCSEFNIKPRNKITFEYILIKNINDTNKDAEKLVKMLSPIKAKVNLIPFNEHEKSNFKQSSSSRISQFFKILLDKNITAIIRKSKGADISAACGQLKGKFEIKQ
ncbi:MAG: 23S rRNA (adenine(2503)-C(2))-methyltransferase [Desulfobacteraceae bacterium 4572_130]|nr:MAG: 23S rRNA (adenine(2503)-C(2))-methyltransferase [Desulfobacteraceae bacterium 4572_130]